MWPWEITLSPHQSHQEAGKAHHSFAVKHLTDFYLQIKRAHWHAPSQGCLKEHYLDSTWKCFVQIPLPRARASTQARIWLAGQYTKQQVLFIPCSNKDLLAGAVTGIWPFHKIQYLARLLNLELLWGYRDKVHSTRHQRHSHKDRCLLLELFSPFLTLRSPMPSEQKSST